MSFMCYNPDLEEGKCLASKKIYSYGKTIEDCENYCSTENNSFLKPYIIRPKNIQDNNDIIAVYKPPYMNMSIRNHENMMNIILINKLISFFNKIKETNNDIKEEFIIFINNFIKLYNIIIKIYNQPDTTSILNLGKSDIINKLIRLYNLYFKTKIDFPTDSNNIFIVYYIIVVSILNKFDKNIDINKFYENINLDILKHLFIKLHNLSSDYEINIEKEYASYNFPDPSNKIGSRSIIYWILNNHYLSKFSISKDFSKDCGICNRLDINTSGICIMALNNNSYMDIKEHINNHRNIKIYTTLLNGQILARRVITNTINRTLFKHSNGFEYNKLADKNLNNHTTIIYPYIIYKDPLDENNYYTLCFIRILSEIQHQIRLHCSSIGHTVVSDDVYNCLNSTNNFDQINKNLSICPRLFLHSTNYIIMLNGIEYNFFCNLPDDLKNILDKLTIVKRMNPKGFKIKSEDYNITIKRLLYHLLEYKFFTHKVKLKN